MRSLDLVHPDYSYMEYLGKIASGSYRLLPYALEFWIEHCSQYASGGGSLGPDRPLQHHMARLHMKHQDCLHIHGRAIDHVQMQENLCANHVDERIEPFSEMPICALMADVLNLRRLIAEFDSDNSSGMFRLISNPD
jgi:hypothetical protein